MNTTIRKDETCDYHCASCNGCDLNMPNCKDDNCNGVLYDAGACLICEKCGTKYEYEEDEDGIILRIV